MTEKWLRPDGEDQNQAFQEHGKRLQSLDVQLFPDKLLASAIAARSTAKNVFQSLASQKSPCCQIDWNKQNNDIIQELTS